VGTGRPAGQPGGGEPPREEAGGSRESGSGAPTSGEPGSEEEAAQAAVEEYLTSLVDGDSATACALLSPEASRQVADLAQSEPGLARDCEAVIDRDALARLPLGTYVRVAARQGEERDEGIRACVRGRAGVASRVSGLFPEPGSFEE
jgi:hypothetical protein